MVVKTPFTENDFKQSLLGYELGKFDRAEPVSQGTVQTNYFIHSTRGKYVFRYYENRSKESVLFEIHLLAYLSDHQFPCPKPCMNNQGVRVGEYREKPYVIYEYIDGQPVEIQTAHHQRQIIQLAAELQKITKHYQPKH